MKFDFDVLTLVSFDNFMIFLDTFDKNYWKSSDKRVYTKGRKKMDKIEIIIKNNSAFKEVFELWDKKKSVQLVVIRNALRIYSGEENG